MIPQIDFNKVGVFTFFVDDFRDDDPKTRDTSPGKVDCQQLRLVGIQRERTWHGGLFGKGAIKNWIFQVGSFRAIVYKQGFNNVGCCLMGISLSRMDYHPNAVPMEEYCRIFLDHIAPDADWMDRNNFELGTDPNAFK